MRIDHRQRLVEHDQRSTSDRTRPRPSEILLLAVGSRDPRCPRRQHRPPRSSSAGDLAQPLAYSPATRAHRGCAAETQDSRTRSSCRRRPETGTPVRYSDGPAGCRSRPRPRRGCARRSDARRPDTMFSRVVLPQPDGPSQRIGSTVRPLEIDALQLPSRIHGAGLGPGSCVRSCWGGWTRAILLAPVQSGDFASRPAKSTDIWRRPASKGARLLPTSKPCTPCESETQVPIRSRSK